MPEKKRHQPPIKVIANFLLAALVLSVLTSITALTHPLLSLNENQILYLFSTTAQVIAAIYGLTLTGFVFFRNELAREALEDDTLSESVKALEIRYYWLLAFITVLVTATLLLANLAIACESIDAPKFNAMVFNAGQSTFVVSLIAVAYFIFDIITPDRIERASKRLQKTVDPPSESEAKGSLEEFVKNYNKIQASLESAGERYREAGITTLSGANPRRMSNARLAEILFRNELIDQTLFAKLRDLITLRNSIIHGAEPVVSNALVKASEDALKELTDSLEKRSKAQ